MQEIELKFQIPEGALAAVTAALHKLAGGQAGELPLRAAYFDTPDRRLGAANMALRIRQEGPDWVQTLKAGGSNTMMRLEDNQPTSAPALGRPIAADLSRHGPAAREALMRALAWSPKGDPCGQHTGLIELYRTDITRTRAQVTVGAGTPHEGVVELALDLGHIHAGPLSMAVRELEIESVSGSPMAVITAGRGWVARHGLWLDTQTKAHRGDRLARQAAALPGSALATGQATLARPAKIDRQATLDQAWRAGLESCLEHITANMSELASHAPVDSQDAAYQLRRGLRRLRALGRLMADAPLPYPHDTTYAAGTLARQLGHWRDQEALGWIPAKLASLGGPDLPLPAPVPDTEQPVSAIELARSGMASAMCLDVLAALLAPSATTGPGTKRFKPWLKRRLAQWQAPCANAASQIHKLTMAQSHHLRRRLRRLRDASDIYAQLWPAKRQVCHAKALKDALDALGAIQDEQVALAWYQAMAEQEPRALFACGWLQARQKPLRKQARQAIHRWVKADAPW